MQAIEHFLEQYLVKLPDSLVEVFSDYSAGFNGDILVYDDPMEQKSSSQLQILDVPGVILKLQESRRRYGWLLLDAKSSHVPEQFRSKVFSNTQTHREDLPCPLIILDIPTQCELWKTLDGTSYMKTTDCAQLLLVGEPTVTHGQLLAQCDSKGTEIANPMPILRDPPYMSDDGITPPSRRAYSMMQTRFPLRPQSEKGDILHPRLTQLELSTSNLEYEDRQHQAVNTYIHGDTTVWSDPANMAYQNANNPEAVGRGRGRSKRTLSQSKADEAIELEEPQENAIQAQIISLQQQLEARTREMNYNMERASNMNFPAADRANYAEKVAALQQEIAEIRSELQNLQND